MRAAETFGDCTSLISHQLDFCLQYFVPCVTLVSVFLTVANVDLAALAEHLAPAILFSAMSRNKNEKLVLVPLSPLALPEVRLRVSKVEVSPCSSNVQVLAGNVPIGCGVLSVLEVQTLWAPLDQVSVSYPGGVRVRGLRALECRTQKQTSSRFPARPLPIWWSHPVEDLSRRHSCGVRAAGCSSTTTFPKN